MTDQNLMDYLDELALEYSITLLTRDKVDLVGSSITLAHHLRGGYCLNTVHDLWLKTGADVWAENCKGARKKFSNLTG